MISMIITIMFTITITLTFTVTITVTIPGMPPGTLLSGWSMGLLGIHYRGVQSEGGAVDGSSTI